MSWHGKFAALLPLYKGNPRVTEHWYSLWLVGRTQRLSCDGSVTTQGCYCCKDFSKSRISYICVYFLAICSPFGCALFIDPSHKSQNASGKHPTMHRFVKKKCAHMCTFQLQNGALWDMGLVHCGICGTNLFIISYWIHAMFTVVLIVAVCSASHANSRWWLEMHNYTRE